MSRWTSFLFRDGQWRYPPWPVSALVTVILLLLMLMGRRCPLPTPAPDRVIKEPPAPRGIHFSPPTPQQRLLDTDSLEVYMPTASGRIESAWYGSTRTRQVNGRVVPSFHMGIDIGPTQRDRQGRASDPILAAADGRVAHINAVSGHSNYGLYIVLTHEDPVGSIYTLYAHLDEIDRKLKVGQDVAAGTRLGRMGHTPNHIIPRHRSHLHFEIGMVLNDHFPSWARAQEIPLHHGKYHGWNLAGIQPLAPYRVQAAGGTFTMKEHLAQLQPAFELLLTADRRLSYFERYPHLWQGAFEPGAIVLSVCEAGIPIRGRMATGTETGSQGNQQSPKILSVDTDVLGRNGRGLIHRRGAAWRLTAGGERWLSILTYHGAGTQ